jgi:hypothetical protein
MGGMDRQNKYRGITSVKKTVLNGVCTNAYTPSVPTRFWSQWGLSSDSSRETVPISSGGDDEDKSMLSRCSFGGPKWPNCRHRFWPRGDVEDLGLAVDSIRCSAIGSVIIVEGVVKPSTEDGDSYRRIRLCAIPKRGFGWRWKTDPSIPRGWWRESRGRCVWLIVGIFGLWKTKIGFAAPARLKFAITWCWVQFRWAKQVPEIQKSHDWSRLLGSQDLGVVVGEPDPSTSEVGAGVAG